MVNSAVILGGNGRFGRAAAQAFRNEGWSVRSVVRPGKANSPSDVECDAEDKDALAKAVTGADVIVHALNPPYTDWADKLPVLTDAVLHAARRAGATVLIPGNVYNFGREIPPVVSESTPQIPSIRKGALRIAMEDSFRAAKDVQTIVLRGGDYIEGKDTGNWFESYLTRDVSKGRFMYPGKTDIDHAWAYLPDMARAAALLADMRLGLPQFTDILFPGYSFTGQALQAHIESAVGRPLKRRKMPWILLRAISPFSRMMREVLEMRYLWNTPHRLDGAKFNGLLPDFQPTPVAEVMTGIFAHGGTMSAQTSQWSDASRMSASVKP